MLLAILTDRLVKEKRTQPLHNTQLNSTPTAKKNEISFATKYGVIDADPHSNFDSMDIDVKI
jgi:hypothetical protein